MKIQSLPVVALALLVLAETHLTSQQLILRERMNDAPTPGILDGLADNSTPRPIFEPDPAAPAVPNPWVLDSTTGARYRAGEILVKFREGAGSSARLFALRQADTDSVLRALPERWELVQLRDQRGIETALDSLQHDPAVEDVSPNYRVNAFQRRPNDEFYRFQWNFDALLLPQAWEINEGASSNVTVAVIDTGLNFLTDTFTFFSPFGQIPVRFAAVPDLVTSTNIVKPFDFVYRDAFPLDLGGHGTHVAGTIAQTTDNNQGVAGIAYRVRLMPLKGLFTDLSTAI